VSRQADFALLGSDKFNEIDESLDLKFAVVAELACRFVFAAPVGSVQQWMQNDQVPSVATSYPTAFTQFIAKTGISAKLGPILKGKVEGAPAMGQADAVFDITETGSSLRDNGLEVVAEADTLLLGGVWVGQGARIATPGFDIAGFMGAVEKIRGRRLNLDAGKIPTTYTERLLSNENELVKKLSSETGELIREVCRADFDADRFISEAADSVYAVEAACEAKNISFIWVLNELANRNKKKL